MIKVNEVVTQSVTQILHWVGPSGANACHKFWTEPLGPRAVHCGCQWLPNALAPVLIRIEEVRLSTGWQAWLGLSGPCFRLQAVFFVMFRCFLQCETFPLLSIFFFPVPVSILKGPL